MSPIQQISHNVKSTAHVTQFNGRHVVLC